MSFEYYANWWVKVKKDLEELTSKDALFRKTAKKVKERYLANELLGGMYAKYCLLVQELDVVLDQMAQVQRRETVKKLVDSAVIRLKELNDEMRKIYISEFHYIDGNLIELKIIPHEIEILHPYMFTYRPVEIEDLWKRIQKGEKIYIPPPPVHEEVKTSKSRSILKLTFSVIDEVFKSQDKIEQEPQKHGDPQLAPVVLSSEEESKKKDEQKKKRARGQKFLTEQRELTEDEKEALRRNTEVTQAVVLIQNHERRRQAQLYWMEFNENYQLNKAKLFSTEQITKLTEQPFSKARESAVVKIQCAQRLHSTRELLKFRERERRLLIGMTEHSWRSNEPFIKIEQDAQRRRNILEDRLREYVKANLDEKDRLFRVVAPGLFEDIGDEIREWFRIWYVEAKNFDKYPPPEKGGTILVIRGETMTPKEWIDEVERKRREKVKAGGRDLEKERKEKEKKMKEEAEKKKKEAEKKKKEEEKKKKKKRKVQDFELEMDETLAQKVYEGGRKEYNKFWIERPIIENPEETYYMDIIHDEKCYEMQMEVREKVDEMMRMELEMLNDALERDRARLKGKKPKKKKPKKNKKKKKTKKGKKDMTSHRSIEELFQELVDNGIIRLYPKTRLSDYFGDFSYNNLEFRKNNYDPPPTLGTIKQAVVVNCIMPLGVTVMKKPKSVLIIGPRKSGKHLLANAVFNETKCVLFDLSPEITGGKYPGKQGLKMLFHLVSKMSRILQPSIIFLDGAEKLWYKKVPKEEKEFEPKRLGNKIIKEIIKPIKPEDRVMVLGITGKPWMAGAKMKKAFERFILIPRPDYNSIYMWWRKLLMPYHGVDRDLDCSALATVTLYYPLSTIKNVVEKVLTTRRMIQLKYNPLKQQELYDLLIVHPEGPVTDKEFKKYLTYYMKSPLGKELKKLNKYYEKIKEAEAKQREAQEAKAAQNKKK